MTRIIYIVSLLLVALLIISSAAAVYYYSSYNQIESQNKTYVKQLEELGAGYSSHILVEFGNGTLVWYNETHFQPGWNVYVATEVVTGGHVNATYYPEYGEHFITSIYDVANSGDYYWGLWTYNSSSSWQMPQVGADDLYVYNGSVYAWSYGANTAPP